MESNNIMTMGHLRISKYKASRIKHRCWLFAEYNYGVHALYDPIALGMEMERRPFMTDVEK